MIRTSRRIECFFKFTSVKICDIFISQLLAELWEVEELYQVKGKINVTIPDNVLLPFVIGCRKAYLKIFKGYLLADREKIKKNLPRITAKLLARESGISLTMLPKIWKPAMLRKLLISFQCQ